MAYKRYFYRNGKKFGPYYYESFRDENGKVKKRYIGRQDPHNKIGEKEIKIPSNTSQANFDLIILVLLLTILILTDVFFVIYFT